MLDVNHRTGRMRTALQEACRHAASVVGLVGLVAASMIAIGLSASPASAEGPADRLPQDRSASLTIHRFDTSAEPGSTSNDGKLVDPGAFSSMSGVNDVTIQIERIVDADLLTDEGWRLADALAAAFDPADTTDWGWGGIDADPRTPAIDRPVRGAPRSDVTRDGGPGAAGIAMFGGLAVGLYLVHETDLPLGAIPSAPFLVALPMRSSADEDWNYDVHVYPKNAVVGIHMTVFDEPAQHSGDAVEWTILSDIAGQPTNHGTRADADRASITSYRITDVLDPRLEYQPSGTGQISAAIIDPSGAVLTGAPLALGADYTVTGPVPNAALAAQYPNLPPAIDLPGGAAPGYDPYDTVDEANSTWLVIEFTPQGLDVLAANANLGRRVKLTVPTTVLPSATGVIPSQAWLYATDASWSINGGPGRGGVPSEQPLTKFGDITFSKVDKDTEAPLAGARFQVFGADAVDANGNLRPGQRPMSIDGVSEWTSDRNGLVTVQGLRYSDYIDDVDYWDEARQPLPNVLPSGWNTYYLVETTAPSRSGGNEYDYGLLAKPIAFHVTASTSTLDLTHYQPDMTVTNARVAPSRDPLPPLAFTGAAGVAQLLAIGGLLGVIGLVLAAAARRRRGDSDAAC